MDQREPATPQTITDVKYILIHGNPVDGFTFYGRFDNPIEAAEYAEKAVNGDDTEWWVAPLHEPEVG